jgi:autophagy-related protein 2
MIVTDIQRYQASPRDTLSWSVDVPAIRISVRVPPPPGRAKRSGILVLDVHKINAVNRPPSAERQLRFANPPATPSIRDSLYVVSDPPSAQDILARVQCQRIVAGVSSVHEEQLTAVLSVGPLQTSSDQDSSLSPQVIVSRREDNVGQLAVNVDVPSVYVSLSKGQLDSLQYWMDDLGQAMERINASPGKRSSNPGSKDSSLIGSRFFAKSRSGSALNSQRVTEEGAETCLALSVTECALVLKYSSASDQVY